MIGKNIYSKMGTKFQYGQGIPLDVISRIPFYSHFNGKVQQFTLGSSHEQAVQSIYQRYIEETEKEMEAKYSAFGGPEGFIEQISLHKYAIESSEQLLANLGEKSDDFSEVSKDFNGTVKELQGRKRQKDILEEDVIELAKKLKLLLASARAYMNEVGKINNAFYDKKGIMNDNIGDTGPKMSDDVRGLRSVQGAYTSLVNAENKIKEFEMLANDVDALSKAVKKNKSIEFVKFKSGGVGEGLVKDNLKSARSVPFSGIAKSISGSISAIKGGILEIEATNALYSAIGDIYKEVDLIGDLEGVDISYMGGEQGDAFHRMNTSRTDVSVATRVNNMDIDLNLSMKNQSSGVGAEKTTKIENTSLLTTSLYTMSKYVSPNAESSIALASNIALGNEYDPIGTDKVLTTFLVALTADFALASTGTDRIDFYVYNDGVVPRSKYIKTLMNNLNATVFVNNKAKENYISALNGEISLSSVASVGSMDYKLSRRV